MRGGHELGDENAFRGRGRETDPSGRRTTPRGRRIRLARALRRRRGPAPRRWSRRVGARAAHPASVHAQVRDVALVLSGGGSTRSCSRSASFAASVKATLAARGMGLRHVGRCAGGRDGGRSIGWTTSGASASTSSRTRRSGRTGSGNCRSPGYTTTRSPAVAERLGEPEELAGRAFADRSARRVRHGRR